MAACGRHLAGARGRPAGLAPRRRSPEKEDRADSRARRRRALRAAAADDDDRAGGQRVSGCTRRRTTCPAGVVSPGITILGPGRVSGRAIVDLDQIREDRKPTSLLRSDALPEGPPSDHRNRRVGNQQWRGHVPVRIGRDQRPADPEARCFSRSSATIRGRPSVHPASASTIPLRCLRAFARFSFSAVRRLSSNSDRVGSSRAVRRCARHAAAVSEGRGSAARGRSCPCRSAHA